VSAFGVGGTNAHIILEEAPERSASSESRPWQLLVLSARTESALDKATTNLAAHLKANPGLNLADVAYTLQVGRKAFPHRRTVVCETTEDAVRVLETADSGRIITRFEDGSDRQIVFMFPGQGSQYVNMALGIYRNEPVFREHVDCCSSLLRQHLGFDLRSLLYPERQNSEKAGEQLNQTHITQPALFVTEYSLAKMLISWGIRPQAMIGHSIGEYVAACLAEVFTLEDALALVTERGRMMQQMPGGAMLAVPLSEEELQPMLSGDLALAAINGLTQCVVSGPAEAVQGIHSRLSERGLVCRRLQTSHAFHSQMMDAIIERFMTQAKRVRLQAPKIPYMSNVHGTWMTEDDSRDPRYWAMQLRQTVRFADGLSVLLQGKDRAMLEVGPGQSLSRLVNRHPLSTPDRVVIPSMRHFNDEQADERYLAQAMGKVWMSGVEVEWEGYYKHERRQKVELPTYPFERQRYWIEAGEGSRSRAVEQEERKGKNREISEWFYIESWKKSLGGGRKKKREEEEDGIWIVMEDEEGLGEEMVRRLRREEKEVVRVRRGKQYEDEEGEGYRLRERRREDYVEMVRRIEEKGKKISQIVHLWGMTKNEADSSEEVSSWKDQDGGFKSVLFLAQAIGKEIASPVRITVASNNVLSVNGSETPQPGKSIVLGACKVIPQEYPGIACRFIDFVLDSDAWRRPKLAKQLLNAIDNNADDAVVAHRGNQRWAQRFEPLRLSREDFDTTVLRNKGVYLITGGLIGIGYELAKYLAKSVEARLIIVDDSELPERQSWAEWLSKSDSHDDLLSKKVRKAQTLERLGAEILIASADSASLIQMQKVVARASARFGPINGVIHSAGVDGKTTFKAIQEIDGSEIEQLFASKLDGLFVLEEILRGIELDFCVLNSSLSSIIGGLGSVAYSSANLFVDAFTQYHNHMAPTSWVSVNWDAWQFEGEKEQLTSISQDLAQLAMLPEEGAEAFRRILSLNGTDQVIVSTSDLAARIEKHVKRGFQPDPLRKDCTTISSPLYPRPSLPNPYAPPASNLERDIASIWQNALGIEQVGVQDNFFELGGDSLIAIQVAAQLNNSLKIEIPVVSLYECLTVRSLVDFIQARQDETSSAGRDEVRETRLTRRKGYQQKQRSRKRDARS
jgi:acyl transferase domain-containing protein/acyl carrier protein